MSRAYTKEALTGECRAVAAGYAFAVRLGGGRTGWAVVPERVAVALDQDDLGVWLLEDLNRHVTTWSVGVVRGRLISRDGLLLGGLALSRLPWAPRSA